MTTAAGCLGWSALALPGPGPLGYPILFTLLIVVSGSGLVRLRGHAHSLITTTTTPAVLAAVLVLPAPWAMITTALGVAAANAVRRRPVREAVFTTARETLGAATAAAAAAAVGLVPVSVTAEAATAAWPGWLLALGVAAVAYTLVDEIVPVVAHATAGSRRRVSGRDRRRRVLIRVVDLATAATTVALTVVEPWLLLVMPGVQLIIYVVYSSRLRLREERRAWRRVAAATDALASASMAGDLGRVLETAAVRAQRLFPSAVAEAQLDGRLVRCGPGGVAYDGPAAAAPPVTGAVVVAPLPEVTPSGQIGVLRLRLPHSFTLADREPYLLQTLAAAVATAIRNAASYRRLVELAERYQHDATHDPLTNLPNRRHLRDHTSQRLAAAIAPVALVLLDLDGFKEVNDRQGHNAGDRVLTEVARRLRAAAGEALVARLGGDEFALVFTAPNATAAAARAEQILAALREPMRLGGRPVALAASAGLAMAEPGIGYDELLRRADLAMYQAKGSRRQPLLVPYEATATAPARGPAGAGRS